jgi:hypothetical protein
VRLDQLDERGPAPEAFTFRKAFDPGGAPVRLKAERSS